MSKRKSMLVRSIDGLADHNMKEDSRRKLSEVVYRPVWAAFLRLSFFNRFLPRYFSRTEWTQHSLLVPNKILETFLESGMGSGSLYALVHRLRRDKYRFKRDLELIETVLERI